MRGSGRREDLADQDAGATSSLFAAHQSAVPISNSLPPRPETVPLYAAIQFLMRVPTEALPRPRRSAPSVATSRTILTRPMPQCRLRRQIGDLQTSEQSKIAASLSATDVGLNTAQARASRQSTFHPAMRSGLGIGSLSHVR